MNEREFVVQNFQKKFREYRKKPMVLYGLGKNTRAILEDTQGYHFVGLMDSLNEGKNIWGYPVLNREQVIRLNAIIVIIARESVVPIIYKRIEDLHIKYGIAIYDSQGTLLGENMADYKNDRFPYWQVTEETIKSAIDMHKVISFDIFDTLIMREVLWPSDMFLLMEQEEVIASIKCMVPFSIMRKEAEGTLSRCPTIHQIYENLEHIFSVDHDVVEQWKKIEYSFEKRMVVARKNVADIFEYALKNGKEVFLLSDMYYSKKELTELLATVGIRGFSDLIVSCDYYCGKEDGGLYEVLKEIVGHENILHIGDNRISDGEKAQEHNIDSFLIYSGYDLWMTSAMQNTLVDVKDLEKRCILGVLVQELCNNPFALHTGRGRLLVDSLSVLGFGFIAPLFGECMFWPEKDVRDFRLAFNMDSIESFIKSKFKGMYEKFLPEDIEIIQKSIEKYMAKYVKMRKNVRNWRRQTIAAEEIFDILFSDKVIVTDNIKNYLKYVC